MQTYLTGFCLMEAGPLMCGLSYNEQSRENNLEKHDRIQSAIIWNLETSTSVKDFLASWNISCHKWLKYYVYLRLLSNNRSKAQSLNFSALIFTFMVSSVWHGFYPGFFVFFLASGLLDYQSKLAYQIFGKTFSFIPEKF